MRVYLSENVRHSYRYHTDWLSNDNYFHTEPSQSLHKGISIVPNHKNADVTIYTGGGSYEKNGNSVLRENNLNHMSMFLDDRNKEDTLLIAVGNSAMYVAERYGLEVCSSTFSVVNRPVMFFDNSLGTSEAFHNFCIDFTPILKDCEIISKVWDPTVGGYKQNTNATGQKFDDVDGLYWKKENIIFIIGHMGGNIMKTSESKYRDVVKRVISSMRTRQYADSSAGD